MNCRRLDNKAKGLIAIDVGFLGTSIDDKMGFVAVKGSIRFCLNMECPERADDVGIRRWRYGDPSVVVY